MDEVVFRIMLATLAAFLYLNHHILHRKPQSKKKAVPLRGVELWLIITPSLWTLCLVFYVVGFDWFSWSLPLPHWLRWSGVAAMVTCAPLSQWIYHALGENFSKTLELQPNHRLIQNGPYRYVRHPMYSTLFLCATATCLISANLYVLAASATVVIVIMLRIKKEEEMLLSRFGENYKKYRQQTGALLPKLL